MRRLELEEGVNAEVNSEDGILVGGIVPLKVVVSANEEGRMSETLVYSQEWSVVGVMD